MTDPTDPAAARPETAGSGTAGSGTEGPGAGATAPEPGYGGSGSGASEAATTAFPAAPQHRAEGVSGGLSKAHSGGAAGRAAPVVSPTERRGPLESVLVLRRIDPWSAFTTVLGLMFALYLVWMVAIGVTYLLLSGMGVWDRLGGLLSGVAGDESASVIGPSTIFLYSGGVGLLNVLLLSILATLAVFIYNLAADLTGGGVQVTLSDRRN
ncbi:MULTISPECIES: DUF3566 domain-containing protein [Dietzia]|uniref:DUF3566 domain-containing protein n=1 Tax=Dietzia TaxID=37914 RepID=UPI000782A4D6|nr:MULTISPECIES: DUF3566 domain-containing protein [Dietzia]MCT1886139.1 DUF3566 domain-containing protein [Dietzia cinnamea]MCT2059327.1 DUF3566 domain-containing protein [Dietzia cinnamea]